MNCNGNEIEVTCTLKNDTIEITITDSNLKFPFININEVAEFLATVYRGIKEEAVLAPNNLLQGTDVSQDTVQTRTKTEESNHQGPIKNIESGNFNGITADKLLQYFRHVYKGKYNEKYTVCCDDKKILEDNIKRFGVEETACRIDKLIYNYETISGGSSKFPRPYVRQLNIHAKNPWISDRLQGMERVVKNTSFTNEKDRKDCCIEIKKEQKMKYNGKEVKVICTLQNDTINIIIIDSYNLKFPFNDINEAAEFLVTEYGGTKEEALIALLNNCISGVVAKHLPESIKNIIVRNKIRQSIPDELKDFVDADRIVHSAISDELKDLIVEAKLRLSKLMSI